MTLDLSYINEQPSEAQEEAVKKAVENECLRAISTYLTEVADTMEANKIVSLSAEALRAMAATFTNRLENGENENG
jgi:3-methyladenine DNA glycosylase AlkD